MTYRKRRATDTMAKRGTGILMVIAVLLIVSKFRLNLIDRNCCLHIPIGAGQTTQRQYQESHKKGQQFHRANITLNGRILFYTAAHYNNLVTIFAGIV